MGLTLVTPPSSYPVTLAEAKLHLKVDGTDEDTLVQAYIAAATDYVEQITGRSIMPQTWRLTQDAFEDSFPLPKGPVQSVQSVQYYDENDTLQTVPASTYTVDLESDPQWIVRNTEADWPVTAQGVNVVRVTYVAGSTVPAAIKQAVLLLVGDYYRNRENTTIGVGITQTPELPHGVKALLANYTRFGF